MAALAKVIIIIVGYRNSADVKRCVECLAGSHTQSFEIVICENGGKSAYETLVRSLSHLVHPFRKSDDHELIGPFEDVFGGRLVPKGQLVRVYCAKKNLGYAGGINFCLRQLGSSEWSAIWILNPDTEPDRDALAALVRRSAEGPYDIVGSRLVLKATRTIQSYGGRWRPLLGRGLNLGFCAPMDAIPNIAEVERSIDYVSGASLFVTRSYIEDVGPMAEDYFLYCEEVDWCLRRGKRPLGYAHEAIVIHAHGNTIGSNYSRKDRSALSVYLDERNKLHITRRFYPAFYPITLLITLLLLFQYLCSGAFKNFFVGLAGWFAGVRGETGTPNFYLKASDES